MVRPIKRDYRRSRHNSFLAVLSAEPLVRKVEKPPHVEKLIYGISVSSPVSVSSIVLGDAGPSVTELGPTVMRKVG